ncbi:hypothetical protein ANCDUO_03802 [Ancylostoma duodenale]|uniref:ATPase family AAA domain-containing protein n=1 Tax=Ancylostoma duodenale TaxID=51022 RepID=A0A0C2H2Z6_9BILA|nr:hypothetical protein ANCDUO_03802 [Ancylostoma duodenale]
MVEVRTSATPSWQEGEDLPVIAIDSFRHMYLFPPTTSTTIEHVLALKHKYELEKIEAETKARAKAARENRDPTPSPNPIEFLSEGSSSNNTSDLDMFKWFVDYAASDYKEYRGSPEAVVPNSPENPEYSAALEFREKPGTQRVFKGRNTNNMRRGAASWHHYNDYKLPRRGGTPCILPPSHISYLSWYYHS